MFLYQKLNENKESKINLLTKDKKENLSFLSKFLTNKYTINLTSSKKNKIKNCIELILNTLFERSAKNNLISLYNKEKKESYILLPQKSNYYSKSYIKENPYLKKIINTNYLSYTRAKLVKDILLKENIIKEETGSPYVYFNEFDDPILVPRKGRSSKLKILPINEWNIYKNNNKKFKLNLYNIYIYYCNKVNKKIIYPSIVRHKYKTKKGNYVKKKIKNNSNCLITPNYDNFKLVNKLNCHFKNYPRNLKEFFRYQQIFNNTNREGGRFYSSLVLMKKEERKELMDILEFKESDIKNCSTNLLYLLSTGGYAKEQDHLKDLELYDNDIYNLIIARFVNKFSEYKKHKLELYGRPLVKKLITILLGCGKKENFLKNKKDELLSFGINKVRYHLVKNGFSKNKKSDQIKNFLDYCNDNNISNNSLKKISIPNICPKKLYLTILDVYKNISDYFLSDASGLTQFIESKMNSYLVDYCLHKKIEFFLIHDAIYVKERYLKDIKEKQLEFLKKASLYYIKSEIDNNFDIKFKSFFKKNKIKNNLRKKVSLEKTIEIIRKKHNKSLKDIFEAKEINNILSKKIGKQITILTQYIKKSFLKILYKNLLLCKKINKKFINKNLIYFNRICFLKRDKYKQKKFGFL